MSDKEYAFEGLEDLCTSLDGIENQLKRLIKIQKLYTRAALSPDEIVELDLI